MPMRETDSGHRRRCAEMGCSKRRWLKAGQEPSTLCFQPAMGQSHKGHWAVVAKVACKREELVQ
eukprot:3774771-Heterocapsa_arctica.AAC.1